MSHTTSTDISPGATAAAYGFAGKVPSMNRHDTTAPAPAGHNSGGRHTPTDEELREISASLHGLRYGSVNIVVQDGVVIQIDRVEKRRLRTRGGSENSRS
jgi:hypothetical protein